MVHGEGAIFRDRSFQVERNQSAPRLADKMSSLRLVRFEDPSDFVDSLRDYDTSAMNFCLGSLLDFINDSQDKPKAIQDSGARIMLAVYKENELM